MQPTGDVAVVIPARNESDRIGETVAAAAGLPGVDIVIVVDDGSDDGTAAAAERAGASVVRHARNRGKAAAMETGAEAIRLLEASQANGAGRASGRGQASGPGKLSGAAGASGVAGVGDAAGVGSAAGVGNAAGASGVAGVGAAAGAGNAAGVGCAAGASGVAGVGNAAEAGSAAGAIGVADAGSAAEAGGAHHGPARPRHLLFLDADLAATAAGAAPLAEPVRSGAADMTIAVFSNRERQGGHGLVVGLSGSGIERATGWRPAQPLNGQRCLTRDAFEAARPLAPGWGAETGLTIDLLRKGLRVVEVEVPLAHRATGTDWRSQLHRVRQLADVARALAVRQAVPRPARQPGSRAARPPRG